MDNSKKNEIAQYKQSKPEQLSLFELGSELEKYSNTIELYDIMPKFYFGGVQREKGKFTESLPILERQFLYREKPFFLSIKPAAIKNKEGKTIHYYPSQREELVEDAIRKLATRGQGVFLDHDESEKSDKNVFFSKEVAVKFTLYEVQKELTRMGHGYNINEIKEAIEVCKSSLIEIRSLEGNEVSISSNIFPSVFIENKEIEGGKNKVVVMLHPLITKSINEGSYRLINYDKQMKLKMPLSRWLHRRMSHIFSQATTNNPYKIKLSTIIRDSGMKEYKTISERIRQVVKALEELESVRAISRFNKENVVEKNKILDVKFYLYVSEEFVADAIKANAIANLRHKHSSSDKIDESYDISKLKDRISEKVFGLTHTVINNIVQKVKSKSEFDEIMESLDAAEQWIEQLKKSGKPVLATSITQKSIREGWKAPDLFNREDQKIKTEEIAHNISVKQKKDQERLKRVESFDNSWVKIRDELEKFNEDSFDKWLKNLELFDFDHEAEQMTLLAESKFIRDWVQKLFLDDKSEDGMLKLIQNLGVNCKKVSIIAQS